jgi:ABC-type branched-subunit amino acid transport system ATPase component
VTATLEARGITVDFGGLRALDDVSMVFPAGAVTGVIGPNGSGKTTLLDVLSGQRAPAAGGVLLDGVDLVDHLPEDRAALGLVRSFQDCRLYPELTVEETLLVAEDARGPESALAAAVALPAARRRERDKRAAVDTAIARLGLARFRDKQVSELSTGTRRVVDLAAILSAQPRVLLLDEPTAGIAQREAEAFGPLLRQLHRATGATIVLVEHDVPLTLSLCDHLVVMEAGRVVVAGPPEEVVNDPAAIAAYLGASPEALARSGLVVGRRAKGRRPAARRPRTATPAKPKKPSKPKPKPKE